MGLYIAKLLSECLSPTCIEDCIINDAEHNIPNRSLIELSMPPPPEINVDLEAGHINGPFGTLTTSCESIYEEPMRIESNTELPVQKNIQFAESELDVIDTDSTPSDPSDETFDYGVIAIADDCTKNNDTNSNKLSEDSSSDDSIFDDVVIL